MQRDAAVGERIGLFYRCAEQVASGTRGTTIGWSASDAVSRALTSLLIFAAASLTLTGGCRFSRAPWFSRTSASLMAGSRRSNARASSSRVAALRESDHRQPSSPRRKPRRSICQGRRSSRA